MKKLMLIRHAKAEKETTGKDFDRPLKYTGMQDAAFMADKVKDNSIVPQLIITSPALRTKTTAEIFSEHLLLPAVTEDKKIYEASEETLLNIIDNLPADKDFVALIGHNPGIAYILNFLTKEVREVHTCTVAVIDFELDNWQYISEGTGKIVYYSSPNE